MNVNEKGPQLLKEHDVARFYGVSIATVRRWRLLRQGPRYLKLNAAVRYLPEDIAGQKGAGSSKT